MTPWFAFPFRKTLRPRIILSSLLDILAAGTTAMDATY